MGCFVCKVSGDRTGSISSRIFEGFDGIQSGHPHHGGVKYSDDYSDSERDQDMAGRGQEGQPHIDGSHQDEGEPDDDGRQHIENNQPDEMDDYGEASRPGEAALPEGQPSTVDQPSEVDRPSQDQPGAVEQAIPVLRDARVLVTLTSETISFNGEIKITRDIVLTSGIEANSDAWRVMREQLGVSGWA